MMRLIAGLATLLSILCFATGVSAHASLVSAEPADGSVLAVAPRMVQLRFNESVTPTVVRLIDATGTTRGDVAVHSVDQSIYLTLPGDLPQGTQVVSYRVISQDGHPVGGSLAFSIGAATGAAVTQTDARSVAGLIWLARIGVYLGLFVGVGGVFFSAWIAQVPAATNVIVAALAVGLGSAVASLGLQGLDVLGLGLGRIVTSAPWKAALATSLGPSLLVAMLAMMACIIALLRRFNARCPWACGAGHGRRRARAGRKRSRRDGRAAMADAADRVSARRRCRVLGRCLGAVGCHGEKAGTGAASGVGQVRACRGAGGRRIGPDRAYAGDHSA